MMINYIKKTNDILKIIEEENRNSKVLYDKNGEFAFWVVGDIVLDADMKAVMYIASSSLWDWKTQEWIGGVIGNGVFKANGDIVYTFNPSERLKKQRVIKPEKQAKRPSKNFNQPKLSKPEKKVQMTPKSFFV